jgi:hypothetical protein
MVIKASAATEIRALIATLSDPDGVRRETAIARLAVIGSRAVERLLAAYAETPEREPRVAMLRVLESLADRRGLPIARAAIRSGGDVAVAGAGVLRALLDSPHAQVAADALDALVSTALDPSSTRHVRQAAAEALRDAAPDVRARVAGALERDPAAEAIEDDPIEAVWKDALDGRLPDSPALLRPAVAKLAAKAPLTSLQKLVDAIRAREAATAGRGDWQALRGAIHQALALRGSRLALYDLRETVAATSATLPASFLAALQVIGDVSCLEPLALAYHRVPKTESWWRGQAAGAFRAIVKRERITRRHAALKRILDRWPESASSLMR